MRTRHGIVARHHQVGISTLRLLRHPAHRQPSSSRPQVAPLRTRRRERGQGVAEFALIWPIFVVCVMGVIEFGIAFNNLLTVNYASRNAALLGAEAGNNGCSDAIILQSIENDTTAPADRNHITQVVIYYSNANGQPDSRQGQLGRQHVRAQHGRLAPHLHLQRAGRQRPLSALGLARVPDRQPLQHPRRLHLERWP